MNIASCSSDFHCANCGRGANHVNGAEFVSSEVSPRLDVEAGGSLKFTKVGRHHYEPVSYAGGHAPVHPMRAPEPSKPPQARLETAG